MKYLLLCMAAVVSVTTLSGCTGARARTNFEAIHGFEPHFILPRNQEVMKNLKTDYGAVGDGKHDDTEAFMKWIEDGHKQLYIPAGEYLVHKQIRYGDGMKRVLVMGEKRSETIIKLAPNSEGFQDPENPKVFFHTRGQGMHAEQNFFQYIYHCTFEIGSGNPGAIGLNFHTNNTGCVKDVAVRVSEPESQKGYIGIAFDDYWFGPGSARYIEVDGFRKGIYVGYAQNRVTLEHVDISNCDAGIYCSGICATDSTRDGRYGLSANEIHMNNCGVGLHASGEYTTEGDAVLINSSIVTEDSGTSAIRNAGRLYVRNLVTRGYDTSISSSTVKGSVVHANVEAWGSHSLTYNWKPESTDYKGLNLPIKESPEYQYPQDPEKMAVMPYGSDITSALQEAVRKGAQTIFLQGGTISEQIHVGGEVVRIMNIGYPSMSLNTGGVPAFSIDSMAESAIVFERIYKNYGSSASYTLGHRCRRTVVFRHGAGGYESHNGSEDGEVFVESVVSGSFIFRDVSAWLRDVNTEEGGVNSVNILNHGSRLWILGHKTEDCATKIATTDNGKTELLGGTYRQNWNDESGVDEMLEQCPLFILDNAEASLSFTTWAAKWKNPPAPNYKYLVEEIHQGMTRSLVHSEFAEGGYSGDHVLFISRMQNE